MKVHTIKSNHMKPENEIVQSQRKKVYSLTIIFLMLCLCLVINIILAFLKYPLQNNLLASLILGFVVFKAYQEMHTQWFVLIFKIHWFKNAPQKAEDHKKEGNS